VVVAVRADENLLLVRGAVPGSRNGTILMQRDAARAEAKS
jgi:ribosomal protein L3